MSDEKIIEEIKKLDPSWDEIRQLYKHKVEYLIGIIEFKKELIEQIELQIKDPNDFYEEIGLNAALEIIKNLKNK